MSDMNVIVLTGHIASDVELKSTKNGIFVCRFRLAVNRPGAKGKTDFFDVSCWRQTAQFVSQYFKKGKRIEVEGTLTTREWIDKEERRHTAYEIQAKEVCFGEKADSDKNSPPLQEPVAEAEPLEELSPEDDIALPF